MSSILMELNLETFEQEIGNKSIPVLIEFYAQWCAPCKMVVPILESLHDTYKHKIKFCTMDIEQGGDLTKRLGINSVPALFFFKNGEVLLSKFGLRRKQDIEKDILGVISGEEK